MANLNEAVENVKSLSRTFQSVIDLANALGDVQSIEQAISESNMRLVKAKKEADWLAATNENAKNDATKLLSDAEFKANEILTSAKQEADALKESSLEYSKKHQANGKVMEEKSRIIQAEIDAKLLAMDESIKVKEQELSDLTAKIDRAKAKMAEMLGG